MPANRYRNAAIFRAELRRFLRQSEECAREHGITPRQYLLLLQIGGSEGATATISSLVERLALTQSAVTELVQRAEQSGFVEREGSKTDGRVVHLRLTAAGEEKLATVYDSLGGERSQLRKVLDGVLESQ